MVSVRIHRIRSVVAVLLGLLLAGSPAPAHARERGPARPLAERLASRVGGTVGRSSRFGVCVIALDGGEAVCAKNADAVLIPASVAKGATAVGALDLLGPGFAYETSLDVRGTVDAAGVLDGDLVIRGAGDPGISKRGHEDDPLWPWSGFARAVRAAGIVAVRGSLVVDDGAFDRTFVHPGWKTSDLDDWYGAPVAGLVTNDACITVLVRGGAAEDRPAAVLLPHGAGPWPVARAVTTGAARRTEVGGLWLDGRSRLRVAGEIGPGLEYAFDTPVPDPLAHAGSVALEALKAGGVSVARGVRIAATPADRAEGRPLSVVRDPLPPLLRTMNRRSQNLYAELIFKRLGVEHEGVGSWESGEHALAAVFARRGVGRPGERVVDGSGLARANQLTAGTLARLLAQVDADPLRGPILRDSLAIPGEEGTLSKRLREADARARVRAKTGTLSGVHSLVGFVDGVGGSRGFAFAIIVNGAPPGGGDPKGFIDDVVRELLDG